ncbi:MAG: hypothetical protein HZB39_21710 [Planctomycetes bacterium]|nr:hypothetical protein [Planctomycetota bacterium]
MNLRTACCASSLLSFLLVAPTAAQVLRPGDLVVTNYSPPNLFVVDRGGVATAVPGAAGALSGPAGVAASPDGAALVCDFNGNRLVRFAADGSSSIVASSLGGPIRVAVDRDGSAIVTAISPPRIVRVLMNGTVIPLTTFSSSSQRPFGVCIDPDRSIVFTMDLAPALRRLDPSTGIVTPIAVGAPLRLPQGVSLFQNGDWAVIDGVTDSVFRVARATSAITTWVSNATLAGNPEGIWPSDDGGFFVAQSAANNNRIALIDAAGATTTFTQGPPFSNIEDCARLPELRGPLAPLVTGPGGQAVLSLDHGSTSAARPYSIVLSGGAWQGFPLPADPRAFTIDGDSLFVATFMSDIPPFFVGFTGLLDASGRANGAIDLSFLPPGLLAGVTLYAQAFDLVPPGPYGGYDFGRFSNVAALRFQ